MKKSRKDTIIAEIENKTALNQTDLASRIVRYKRNLLYLVGEQWLVYNKANKSLLYDDRKDEGWMPQPVDNKIINAYQVNLSKLSKTFPAYYVISNSNEQNDRNATEISGKIIDFDIEDNKIEEKEAEMWGWTIIFGDCFRKRYWTDDTDEYRNKTKWTEKTDKIDVMGLICIRCGFEFSYENYEVNKICPECGTSDPPREDIIKIDYTHSVEDGYEEIEIEKLLAEVVPPQNIIVPKYAISLETTPWLIEQKYCNVEAIKLKWGEKAEGLSGGDESIIFDLSFNTINDIMNNSSLNSREFINTLGSKEINDDLVKYIEYYELPTKDYPEGYFCVVAGTIVLEELDYLPMNENNKKKKKLPYFQKKYIRVPGSFWSIAMIDNGVKHQDRINAINAVIHLNRKLNVFARWMYPVDSIREGIPSNPTKSIEYQPIDGMKPEPVWGQGLPGDVYRELDYAIREFDLATYTTPISQGHNPKGVYSGVAINFLSEESDIPLYPIVKYSELSLQDELRWVLLQYNQKKDKEFILRIVGMDNESKVLSFKGSDIDGNTDLRIRFGSSFPKSMAGQQDIVLAMIDRGILGDVVNDMNLKEEILKIFGFAGRFQETFNVHKNKAIDENYRMLYKGEFDFNQNLNVDYMVDEQTGGQSLKYPGITSFDDDRIHYAIHLEVVLSPSFYKYDDEIQKRFIEHLNMTRTRLFEKMSQQQMQAPLKAPAGG